VAVLSDASGVRSSWTNSAIRVGLLEQARVLDRDRRLRAQHSQHGFIRVGEAAAFLVQHFQHTDHFILCDQGIPSSDLVE
jgi:hypothetical protein